MRPAVRVSRLCSHSVPAKRADYDLLVPGVLCIYAFPTAGSVLVFSPFLPCVQAGLFYKTARPRIGMPPSKRKSNRHPRLRPFHPLPLPSMPWPHHGLGHGVSVVLTGPLRTLRSMYARCCPLLSRNSRDFSPAAMDLIRAEFARTSTSSE